MSKTKVQGNYVRNTPIKKSYLLGKLHIWSLSFTTYFNLVLNLLIVSI